jgi:type 1 fimbria pilin
LRNDDGLPSNRNWFMKRMLAVLLSGRLRECAQTNCGTRSVARRRALLSCLFLGALLIPGLGHADCSWVSRDPYGFPTTSTPWYFNFSFPQTVTVSRAAQPGTVIASSTITGNYQNKVISCSGWFNNRVTPLRTIDPYDSLLLHSGVPGIAFKARRTRGTTQINLHWNSSAIEEGGRYTYAEDNAEWVLQAVKTDTVLTGGQINSGLLAQWALGSATYLYFSLANSLTIVPQTCTVTTPNVNVPLTPARGISQSAFTGVGSTSAQVGFGIGVNCSGVASNVFMTVTDQQTPGNTGNAMALTTSSTAIGLGIQILHNNTPVGFGPDSSVPGNVNQFAVFTSSGAAAGPAYINLSARYIQTAAVVTAGSANGLATFTMSYQ